MIVIDVGCARYGGDYSIERLIEEFDPSTLYGFDPNSSIRVLMEGSSFDVPGRQVLLEQKAAWTYDGEIGYLSEGLNSCLSYAAGEKVECFDLARFIHELPRSGDIVLKMDAEGSEYELLDWLISKGADLKLKLAWVEWHPFGVPDHAERRKLIERRIGCELTEWRW